MCNPRLPPAWPLGLCWRRGVGVGPDGLSSAGKWLFRLFFAFFFFAWGTLTRHTRIGIGHWARYAQWDRSMGFTSSTFTNPPNYSNITDDGITSMYIISPANSFRRPFFFPLKVVQSKKRKKSKEKKIPRHNFLTNHIGGGRFFFFLFFFYLAKKKKESPGSRVSTHPRIWIWGLSLGHTSPIYLVRSAHIGLFFSARGYQICC